MRRIEYEELDTGKRQAAAPISHGRFREGARVDVYFQRCGLCTVIDLDRQQFRIVQAVGKRVFKFLEGPVGMKTWIE